MSGDPGPDFTAPPPPPGYPSSTYIRQSPSLSAQISATTKRGCRPWAGPPVGGQKTRGRLLPVQDTQRIMAGQDTPMDTVSRADAVLKAVAQAVIRQGKRTKRTRLKTNTQQWHKHFQVVKKRIAQELRPQTPSKMPRKSDPPTPGSPPPPPVPSRVCRP